MIQQLILNEFTVFKKVSFDFGSKLNILIGENGSGKTQILKFLYASLNLLAAYQKDGTVLFGHVVKPGDAESFKSVFKAGKVSDLINLEFRNKKIKVLDAEEQHLEKGKTGNVVYRDMTAVKSENTMVLQKAGKQYRYDVNLQYTDIIVSDSLAKLDAAQIPFDLLPKALFLPTHELLTIFPHYLALRKEYQLPYDSTYDDTIGKLGLPYRNQDTEVFTDIVNQLEKAIDGKIFLKDEKFYFHPNSANDDQTLDINMTAEGWRKLGMLLQLLKNGALRRGMVLLWDEPEANLNPRLICLIAQVLLQLSQMGIQVFLTTHSLFLLKELDMLTKEKGKFKSGETRYFNFLKPGKVEQGDTPEDLSNILLLDESLAQSDRYLQMED